MIDYIVNHIGEISSLVTVSGAVLWAIRLSHNSLHKDICRMRDDIKDIRQDIRNVRQDIKDANVRIDNVYTIIMTMLTKEKKTK